MARRRFAPRRQRGVALITVLLVVALAAVAAAEMTRQGQLDQRRTGNRLAREQAHQIALGGEQWARAILARDRRNAGDSGDDGRGSGTGSSTSSGASDSARVDARDEDWARDLPPIPVEGGQVAGAISDAQGRFNINNLRAAGDRVSANALARLERLLAAVDIEPRVAQAIVDWIDADSETIYPRGAEDDFYAGRQPPYRAANATVATASELRLVRGIDDAAWAALAPHVTALPSKTPINVNTATPVVLEAAVDGLDSEAARTLHEAAGEEPFTSVAEFREHPLLDGLDVSPEGLAVGSHHFRVRVDVEMGPLRYTLYSWLGRDDEGRSRVLRRARTPN
jgi:general secretion pathway protein K